MGTLEYHILSFDLASKFYSHMREWRGSSVLVTWKCAGSFTSGKWTNGVDPLYVSHMGLIIHKTYQVFREFSRTTDHVWLNSGNWNESLPFDLLKQFGIFMSLKWNLSSGFWKGSLLCFPMRNKGGNCEAVRVEPGSPDWLFIASFLPFVKVNSKKLLAWNFCWGPGFLVFILSSLNQKLIGSSNDLPQKFPF